MVSQNSQAQPKSKKAKTKKTRHLSGYQLFLLKIVSSLAKLWTRTLQFQFGKDVQTLIESSPPPVIAVLWHNRLFVVPEFYRRYVHKRKLAGIVSSSSAGAWLSALFEQMGIKPIRGSSRRRGVQAFREMLQAQKSGYDIGITPDGSRGPIYDMKAGAATLGLLTGAPIVLLSYNFKNAFRLTSWDRFYIPFPFSTVEVKMEVIEEVHEMFGNDADKISKELKVRLDALSEDTNEYLSKVI